MNKPGCYGAASVFSHDSDHCKACAYFQECATQSLERLEAISGTINVSDLLKKHARAAALSRPERAARQQVAEERDQRVVQRAAPIEPPQRKTQIEKVTFEIDPATQDLIANISNKKAQGHALILCKGQDLEALKEKFSGGENPMPLSPKWLHQVGEELLRGEGVTKQDLKVTLGQHQAWTDGTAGSHVSIAWAMFMGLGITVERNGQMILSPSPEAHN